ncbi:hypothetical protein EV646_108172 [Kribbella antiqua]|uniref:Uncharacterized protein n=1 Tax=Kribbella antiqua TaxID=2512217 RepID=A0A4R2INI1_9ACTN|nr:hypothetical protein EV646_108172 [Kribbella antiqua]
MGTSPPQLIVTPFGYYIGTRLSLLTSGRVGIPPARRGQLLLSDAELNCEGRALHLGCIQLKLHRLPLRVERGCLKFNRSFLLSNRSLLLGIRFQLISVSKSRIGERYRRDHS